MSPLIGGAGFLAIGLAQAVRDRGTESQAWVPGPGPAAEALERSGVPWHAYSLDSLKRGGVWQLAALGSMWRRLRHAGALVHVHNPTVYGLLSPMLERLGARAAVQFHIDPTEEEVRWALRKPPAVVMTCSKHIAAQVREINTRAGRDIPVVPVQNAIDLTRYTPGSRLDAKRLVGAPLDRPLVLMMANLAAHKGQVTAVHAVRYLRDRGVLVDCWLAGEDREDGKRFEASLRTLVQELGVADRVSFLGFRTDGPELLRAADFFLLPSTHEGLPLSVLEAQASGTLVLASPIPGNREVIADGETGFLIDPQNHEGYAARIAALVSDRAAYERVTAAALERVRSEHSWTTYVDRTWQVYREICGVAAA